jgi:hypothetical protein
MVTAAMSAAQALETLHRPEHGILPKALNDYSCRPKAEATTSEVTGQEETSNLRVGAESFQAAWRTVESHISASTFTG